MRKLGIHVIREQQAKVLSGEREIWIWLQHQVVKVGDEADFLDADTKKPFAWGTIVEVEHTTVSQLTWNDVRRASFDSWEDLIDTLRAWDSGITKDSPITAMRFGKLTPVIDPKPNPASGCQECDERDQT